MIKFWNFIRNSTEDSAELYLYGELCSDEPWYTEDYVAYRQFVRELKDITESTIHLRINSPGGEVMAANVIFNQLQECGKTIIAYIDGMCASAATIPLMAADKIIASCNAMILIHDPLVCLTGYYNRSELDKMGELCDKIKNGIIATYRSRMRDVSEEEFGRLMTEERWLDANEAQELGLVDEVAYSDIKDVRDNGSYLIINSVKVKKQYFKNLPASCRKGIAIKQTKSKNAENKGGNRRMDENEIKSLDDLKKKYPKFCKDIAQAAVKEERQRMKELDQIGTSVPGELLEEAKYGERPMNAKELAFNALLAENKAGNEYFEKMKDDVKNSKAGAVPPSPEAGDTENQGEDGDTERGEASKAKISNLASNLNNDRRRERKA